MELNEKWKKLQNGSDIRGVALEGVAGENVNISEDVVAIIASAFVVWLKKRTGKTEQTIKTAVGTDSRISGPSLKNAVINSISNSNVKVSDCGIASTPAMFMACVLQGLEFDGTIMITASHLPFNRNGLKFFTKDGGLEKKDITAILELAQDLEQSASVKANNGSEQNGTSSSSNINDDNNKSRRYDNNRSNNSSSSNSNVSNNSSCGNNVTSLDLISIYSEDLCRKIRIGSNSDSLIGKPLEGLKIIVDAGNGAGGFFVDKVLKPLGADTTGSQFLMPDGNFPNHIPNPEDADAMKAIQNAVLENKADFGIIFDTDVDRAGAVDKYGKEINRNRIIALMAAIVLEEHNESTIVTDSITSAELKEFIENKLGGKHLRFKRGYKNVINEAIRLNSIGEEAYLAIETSGHGALKENYFMDDGAYLIAKMLIKIAQLKSLGLTIDSLISELAEPSESKEFRFKIGQTDFKSYGENVLKDLFEYANNQDGWNVAPDNFEGIRVSFDKTNGNGWFLLRMSLHDPLMPLNIESNNIGGVREIAQKIIPFISKYDFLDVTGFIKYCNEI